MMTLSEKKELYNLLNALCEGVISDEQYGILDKKLSATRQACEIYVDFTSIWSQLRFFQTSLESLSQQPDSVDKEYLSGDDYLSLLRILAEHERTAPSIEVPTDKPKEDKIQKVVYPVLEKRKLSKFSLFSFITSAAAILFLVLYVNFAPVPGEQVAVLEDVINAKFSETSFPLEKGSPLITNQGELFLQKGLAKIVYDNGVELTLEGPVEFELESPMDMSISYGRLYARVPKTAMGFTVLTENSRIVDMGTEFGVYASQGNTELHVLDGMTTLIAGRQKQDKQTENVFAGQAIKIRGDDSHIEKIALKQNYFVRKIDSQKQFIWKGQRRFSLTNLVAGGDGFGISRTGKTGINPSSGAVEVIVQDSERPGNNTYSPVPQRQFVDGVFVPNGASGPNVVSSAGHTFEQFPSTNGSYWTQISATGKRFSESAPEGIPISLNPDAKEESILLMHANAGITFDLNKIRQSLSGLEITGLSASCGLARYCVDQNKINVCELWVLVDGQSVFHHEVTDIDSAVRNINVPIKPEHQFLTLVTTDGGNTNGQDWGLFGSPELNLETEE